MVVQAQRCVFLFVIKIAISIVCVSSIVLFARSTCSQRLAEDAVVLICEGLLLCSLHVLRSPETLCSLHLLCTLTALAVYASYFILLQGVPDVYMPIVCCFLVLADTVAAPSLSVVTQRWCLDCKQNAQDPGLGSHVLTVHDSMTPPHPSNSSPSHILLPASTCISPASPRHLHPLPHPTSPYPLVRAYHDHRFTMPQAFLSCTHSLRLSVPLARLSARVRRQRGGDGCRWVMPRHRAARPHVPMGVRMGVLQGGRWVEPRADQRICRPRQRHSRYLLCPCAFPRLHRWPPLSSVRHC